MASNRNVFINCPFDPDFYPLLRPLLFTIVRLGLTPRIALEDADSGRTRINKIAELIADSRYAIHDLSRIEAKKAGELFRLNMPFELGIDVGCRLFGGTAQAKKKCLILEAQRYRYQAALSDLSGSDISCHDNHPDRVVTVVRNWLANACGLKAVPSPTRIWGAFNDFMAANYDVLTTQGFAPRDIEERPVPELIADMKAWVASHP